MEKRYNDLKMRKILFTYREYDYDDCDTLILCDEMSDKEAIEAELDMIDEKKRIESDLIGIGNLIFDDDDCLVDEDATFLELQEYKSNNGGVILRFYSSLEDFEKDNYFGNVIIDTKFTIDSQNKKDKRVIRDILREYGIASFGNKALEKKREILFNIPVDDVVDRRSSNVSSNDGKVMCKRKD